MSLPFKGWNGALVFSGDLVKEECVGSPAVAAQTIFYTNSFPIVNSSTRVVTDTSSDITVYDNGSVVDSGNYTIVGSLGKITFGTAPGAGHEILVTYSYTLTAGFIQNAGIETDNKLDGIYGYGSRLPGAIGEGDITIKLTCQRAFVDRDLVGKAIAELGETTFGEGSERLPAFTINLYPKGVVSTAPYFILTGAKCNTWKLNGPQNAWVTEDSEFLCATITPATVS